MYTIVHFIDENSVEVVPSMWVKTSNNGTSNCFWPPKHTFKGQALTKALESCIAPDMQWDMYSAEILKVTGINDFSQVPFTVYQYFIANGLEYVAEV